MAEPNDFTCRVRETADRLAAHGVDALGALFDLTARRLVRFAAAITRQQHDAEDAVQAALMRLASEPALLAAAQCPWAYLLRMVRNEALAVLRRNQRCNSIGDVGDLILVCPVDEAERAESHLAVWQAIRSLPAEQAEVVVLKIWENLTFAEIGQVLDASLNTVASRYKYAMAKLAKSLASTNREVYHG